MNMNPECTENEMAIGLCVGLVIYMLTFGASLIIPLEDEKSRLSIVMSTFLLFGPMIGSMGGTLAIGIWKVIQKVLLSH
jgi:hypothetical protein